MTLPEFSALHSVSVTVASNLAVCSIWTPVQTPLAVTLYMDSGIEVVSIIHHYIITCMLHYVIIVPSLQINFYNSYNNNWTHTPGQLVGVTSNETPETGCASNRIVCAIVCIYIDREHINCTIHVLTHAS